LAGGAVLCLAVLFAAPAHAQAQDAGLRAQQDTLLRIRREREELERRQAQLQTTAHDLSEEMANLDRRTDATARLINAIDTQLAMIATEVNTASRRVNVAERELTGKKSALRERLIEIYKRGPMFTTEALLSAHSFGELVARYKYLHLLALHDRVLVGRVEELRNQVRSEQQRLVSLQAALAENRADKQHEQDQLQDLQRQRGASLARTEAEARATAARLEQIHATELQFANLMTSLETERRRAETVLPSIRRPASSIRTSEYGHLDWPVDGPLIYTFGKAQTASNTTIRWNGVGIKAAIGASVEAVAPGRVVSVGPLGTYGLTVIIDHGGGDYSIYGSLSRSDVRQGQSVAKGQVIGGVGISDPDLPPHVHFEIRHAGADGRPGSVDPAGWLRERR
jgi:septal ring factor EnvC (AmiA/AmiB activator)